jgi:hypothetical protein
MTFTAEDKDPAAILDYEMDWSLWLAEGETIVSATVQVAESDLALTMISTVDGKIVRWRAEGGSAGSNYDVTVEVNTSSGQRDQRTVRFPVRDR